MPDVSWMSAETTASKVI